MITKNFEFPPFLHIVEVSLKVVQSKAILFLESVSERGGSDIERHWDWIKPCSINFDTIIIQFQSRWVWTALKPMLHNVNLTHYDGILSGSFYSLSFLYFRISVLSDLKTFQSKDFANRYELNFFEGLWRDRMKKRQSVAPMTHHSHSFSRFRGNESTDTIIFTMIWSLQIQGQLQRKGSSGLIFCNFHLDDALDKFLSRGLPSKCYPSKSILQGRNTLQCESGFIEFQMTRN